MSACPCTGTRATSPYTLIARFLREHIDASPLERERTDGRERVSELLEIEVTAAGYRLLVAPLLYADAAEDLRLTDDEIARHARWWLDQLP